MNFGDTHFLSLTDQQSVAGLQETFDIPSLKAAMALVILLKRGMLCAHRQQAHCSGWSLSISITGAKFWFQA